MRVMEIFCILIVVVVLKVYITVKTHVIAHCCAHTPKKGDSNDVSELNKKERLNRLILFSMCTGGEKGSTDTYLCYVFVGYVFALFALGYPVKL